MRPRRSVPHIEPLEPRRLLAATAANYNWVGTFATEDSSPTHFATAGDHSFFVAKPDNSFQSKPKLFVTDNTTLGTHTVSDLDSKLDAGSISDLTSFGNRVIFTDVNGTWVSDGTSAGTVFLTTTRGFLFSPSGDNQCRFFSHVPGSYTDTSVYLTDGTPNGTHLAIDGSKYQNGVQSVTTFNGSLYFLTTQGVKGSYSLALWKSDGTPNGATLVAGGSKATDPQFFSYSYDPFYAYNLVAATNRLYFFSDDSAREELWVSDGTSAGTHPVSTYDETAIYSLADPILWHDHLVFNAGNQLYVSDDTPAGSHLLSSPDLSPFSATTLITFNDDLYAVNRYDKFLYRTSALDSPLAAVSSRTTVTGLQAAGPYLYFLASDNSRWRTDGTDSETIPVPDASQADPRGDPVNPADAYVFPDTDLVHGLEPWIATPAGKRLLVDINTAALVPRPGPNLLPVGSSLFLTATDKLNGTELWQLNSAANTISLVTDLNPGPVGSNPSQLTAIAGRLAFVSSFSGTPVLYSTTTIPGEIIPLHVFPANQPPANIVTLGSHLYFTTGVFDGTSYTVQLWSTDGTSAGTNPVYTFPDSLSPAGGFPAQLTVAPNGTLVLELNEPSTSTVTLWTSDGTAAGTHLLRTFTTAESGGQQFDLIPAGDSFVFFTSTNSNSSALWASDGTPSGTHRVATIDGNVTVNFIAYLKSRLYFWVSGDFRHELWRTDVTATGTMMLDSINFNPSGFAADANSIFLYGRENANVNPASQIYVSDGEKNGTVQIPSTAGLGQFNQGVVLGSTLYLASGDLSQNLIACTGDTTAPTKVATVSMATETPILLSADDSLYYASQFDVPGSSAYSVRIVHYTPDPSISLIRPPVLPFASTAADFVLRLPAALIPDNAADILLSALLPDGTTTIPTLVSATNEGADQLLTYRIQRESGFASLKLARIVVHVATPTYAATKSFSIHLEKPINRPLVSVSFSDAAYSALLPGRAPVAVTIDNQGTAPLRSAKIVLYAKPDGAPFDPATATKLLTKKLPSLNLAPGAHATANLKPTVPRRSGLFNIVAIVVPIAPVSVPDIDPAISHAISIDKPQIDLDVYMLPFHINNRVATVSVQLTEELDTSIRAKGVCTLTFYASDDQTLSPSHDRLLGTYTHSVSIALIENLVLNYRFSEPPLDGKYIFVKMKFSGNYPDINPENNVSSYQYALYSGD